MPGGVSGGRVLAPVLLALSSVAWLALAVWGQSPYARYLDHKQMDAASGSVLLPVFLLGWLLMLVAMMLPTTLPLVRVFSMLIRRRPEHRRLQLIVLLVLGYLSSWSLFGLFVDAADAMLHALVRQSAALAEHAWVIGPAVLVLAGIYQFTPLKYQCLYQCRSPLTFISERWRGRYEIRTAFRIGVDDAVFCIGCCWSLMLLMFAVGMGNFGWMLGLGAIMAIEKNVSWGRRISIPVGIALVGLGAATSVAGAPT